jgi:hypothetical protein
MRADEGANAAASTRFSVCQGRDDRVGDKSCLSCGRRRAAPRLSGAGRGGLGARFRHACGSLSGDSASGRDTAGRPERRFGSETGASLFAAPASSVVARSLAVDARRRSARQHGATTDADHLPAVHRSIQRRRRAHPAARRVHQVPALPEQLRGGRAWGRRRPAWRGRRLHPFAGRDRIIRGASAVGRGRSDPPPGHQTHDGWRPPVVWQRAWSPAWSAGWKAGRERRGGAPAARRAVARVRTAGPRRRPVAGARPRGG